MNVVADGGTNIPCSWLLVFPHTQARSPHPLQGRAVRITLRSSLPFLSARYSRCFSVHYLLTVFNWLSIHV